LALTKVRLLSSSKDWEIGMPSFHNYISKTYPPSPWERQSVLGYRRLKSQRSRKRIYNYKFSQVNVLRKERSRRIWEVRKKPA
jgi:hypothetical protein